MAGLAELSEALHPSPWPATPRAEVKSASFLSRSLLVGAAPPADLDLWARRHFDELVGTGWS